MLSKSFGMGPGVYFFYCEAVADAATLGAFMMLLIDLEVS